MVLASMEMTVTSTAMPTIIGELHGIQHYAWVASIYLLASTVVMPLYGRLADKWGRKVVIIGAIALFTVGSVLAAGAHSMMQLIVFRGIQGLGAGGIMPVVLTILGDIFTLEERAKIQGYFSAVWGLAALAGPALGALLVKTLGWRWVFLVNLPFGALGLAALAWKYHEHEEPHPSDLDLPGVISLAAACMALLLLVSRLGGPDQWSLPAAATLALLTVLPGGYFVWHEARVAKHPIMDPALMFQRAIGPSMLGMFLFGLGFICLDTYVPLYVQGARGGGTTAAASAVTPVMLTWALSALIAAPLMIRWGFRKAAIVGSLLVIVGFGGLLLGAIFAAPHWLITAVLAITGFGFGFCSMSYLLSAQDAVEWQQRGSVTSGIGFFRTIGGAIGVGVLGAVLNMLIRPGLAILEEQGISAAAVMNPEAHSELSPEVIHRVQDTLANGLIWVFAAMLASAVLQLAVSTLLPRKQSRRVNAAEAMEAMAG
jgi:MFS family permease